MFEFLSWGRARKHSADSSPPETPLVNATPIASRNTKTGFSSDADIDDFIADLRGLFQGEPIAYVDVGAFIGEVFRKLWLSKAIDIREAHLIEPNPESYALLTKAVADVVGVRCYTYDVGVSAVPGVGVFRSDASMTKRLRSARTHQEGDFESRCERLDELLVPLKGQKVNLLKIDVEGEELDVLQSAESFFAEERIDVVYIEVGWNKDGTQQTYVGEIDKWLQEFGYRAFKIYEQKNEWPSDSPLLRRSNIAYLSRGFASSRSYSQVLKNIRSGV